MSRLKPCPFCGGEAFIRRLYTNYIIDAKHGQNCPMANMPLPYDSHWVTMLAAEAAWNTRVKDDDTAVCCECENYNSEEGVCVKDWMPERPFAPACKLFEPKDKEEVKWK